MLYRTALFLSLVAAAEATGQTATNEALERRVEELEAKLKRVEQALGELQARQNGPNDPRSAGSPAADTDEFAPTLETLDQRIRVLDRQTALDKEAAAAKAQEAGVAVAGRDGFWIKSANGDFRLNLGGYVQSDGRFYVDNTNSQGTNTFLLRRVRPILQGTLYKNIDFRLVPDFGGGAAVVQDAYLDFRYFTKAVIRAGKFKAPLGLEQLQADQDLVFVERGLPTNLVPNRDLGIQVSGDLAKSRLNYAVGVFDGVPDGGSVDGDNNNRKDIVARLFATPLKGLGVGIAASTGKQDGALPSFKTPGQVTFFSYGSTITAAGARTRFSPQAYYYYGPLGALFEYVRSEQRVRKGTSTPMVSNNAWQLATSYVLTGERKTYKGVSPIREFDPFRGGWGAWEVVARFEQLELDPAIFTLGLADPTKSASRARAWAAGTNWYLNRNVKLVLDYQHTAFSKGAPTGDRRVEHAVLSRFQIGF